MSALTKAMCWKMVKKTEDSLNQVGLAIFQKPIDNSCYEQRADNSPPLCQDSADSNAAWNVPLQACMHKVPVDQFVRGSQWPEQWPQRADASPYWLNNSQTGVHSKPTSEDFEADYQHWKRVVSKSYLKGMGIDWSTVRNVMDMQSVYGGYTLYIGKSTIHFLRAELDTASSACSSAMVQHPLYRSDCQIIASSFQHGFIQHQGLFSTTSIHLPIVSFQASSSSLFLLACELKHWILKGCLESTGEKIGVGINTSSTIVTIDSASFASVFESYSFSSAVIYAIEFQKRGFSHAHILVFVCGSDRPKTIGDVDRKKKERWLGYWQ